MTLITHSSSSMILMVAFVCSTTSVAKKPYISCQEPAPHENGQHWPAFLSPFSQNHRCCKGLEHTKTKKCLTMNNTVKMNKKRTLVITSTHDRQSWCDRKQRKCSINVLKHIIGSYHTSSMLKMWLYIVITADMSNHCP